MNSLVCLGFPQLISYSGMQTLLSPVREENVSPAFLVALQLGHGHVTYIEPVTQRERDWEPPSTWVEFLVTSEWQQR